MNVYIKPGKYTIEEAVSESFDVSVDAIISTVRNKKREPTEARQFAMWIRNRYTKDSLKKIGSIYYRDHATVLHASKTVNDLLETNAEFRQKAEKALSLLDIINN